MIAYISDMVNRYLAFKEVAWLYCIVSMLTCRSNVERLEDDVRCNGELSRVENNQVNFTFLSQQVVYSLNHSLTPLTPRLFRLSHRER